MQRSATTPRIGLHRRRKGDPSGGSRESSFPAPRRLSNGPGCSSMYSNAACFPSCGAIAQQGPDQLPRVLLDSALTHLNEEFKIQYQRSAGLPPG